MAEYNANFITEIIDQDIANGFADRIHTRFPPEPNGYLHIGSAKAIFINYSTAKKYGGLFNLRYDDTNPVKEDTEYVESIEEDLRWLGAIPDGGIFYGSDYFDQCYEYAIKLIQDGKAYVCDLTADEMREYRGTLTQPGKESPYRNRSIEENLDLFQRMKNGSTWLPQTSICATPPSTGLSAHTITARETNGVSTHCMITPIQYRMQSRGSPIPSVRSSLRTTARSTTGWSTTSTSRRSPNSASSPA